MIDLYRGERGTERSDIDMVVFLQNLDIDQHIAQLRAQLELFQTILTSAKPALKDLKISHRTKYAICFSVDGVSIDLLPAFGLTGSEDTARKSIVVPLDKPELWKYYSKCFCQEQVDFVSQRDAKLKGRIRLLKFWKTRFIWPEKVKISSYLMELVAIHLHPNSKDTLDFFNRFIDLIRSPTTISITFGNQIHAFHFRNPIVLDPANPLNNVGDVLQEPGMFQLLERAAGFSTKVFETSWSLVKLSNPIPHQVRATVQGITANHSCAAEVYHCCGLLKTTDTLEQHKKGLLHLRKGQCQFLCSRCANRFATKKALSQHQRDKRHLP